MATFTLKDFPEKLHRPVRERAEAHGRSLNQEVVASLDQAATPGQLVVSDYLSRVERVRDRIHFELSLDEMQKAIETGGP